MAETEAASLPAETQDPFKGQQPTMAEFESYRQSGELPARFKKAEPAASEPADRPKKTASEGVQPESEGESETPEQRQQEQPDKKPHQTAEQRISVLRAKIEELWQQDEPDSIKIAQLETTIEKIEGNKQRKTAPAPVTPPRPAVQQQSQGLRSKPTIDDKDESGNPKYATYEDYVEDLADWKSEQRVGEYRREQQQQAQLSALQSEVNKGVELYGADFSRIADETAGAIGADQEIPQIIKQRFGKSNVLPHLTYTIGGDAATLAKFISTAKSDPFAALDYIALTENQIRETLAQKTGERDTNGQFRAKETPAKTQTSAPKPPSPVGGSSSKAFDVSDDSLSPDEWMRQRNKQLGKV